jgi:hypothetical protein
MDGCCGGVVGVRRAGTTCPHGRKRIKRNNEKKEIQIVIVIMNKKK